METKFEKLPGGDPQVTITLTGGHDIFRFAVNMLDDQVEYHAEGRRLLARLRKHMGVKPFEDFALRLLTEYRFRMLRPYFRAPKED